MSSPSGKWSVNDARFLRSLGIVADAPAPPSPRFVVEPAAAAGFYRVIDRGQKKHPKVDEYGPKSIPNARAAAEDRAAELNARHSKRGEQL